MKSDHNTGDIIKSLRKEKGLTQEEFGRFLGVQKSAVAKWENGRTRNLKKDTVDAIAVLCGVQPSFVRGETGEALLLDADEIEMIKAFRKTDKKTKKAIKTLLGFE